MEKQSVNYLKKLNSESVVQQVINCLTDAMINRQLRPGDKIPTESELSVLLGVGRNSIREAIKILVYLGVLEIRRAEGTFVCEGFSESMIDPMIYGIILDKSDSYENLIELREFMEVGVMKLAIDKCGEDDIKNLKNKLDRMEYEVSLGVENIENIFNADNEFHDTISHMGKNPLIDKINQVVRLLTHSIRLETVSKMIENDKGNDFLEVHRSIYNIICSKDKKDINSAVRKTYFID